jgi:hypothetical protein
LNIALVTGTIDHTQFVALALKREGFDPWIWDGSTPGAADGPPPGSVDCYVQLPAVPAQWSKACAGPVLAAPLVHRLDTVAAVAKLLAPDAVVLLVADEPDWDAARRQTLRALAEAAVIEQVGPGRRIALVETGDVGDIAAAARRELAEARSVSLADLGSDLAHVDWRNEIMNLTSAPATTYFGWRRPDGGRRAAVLRRSVLSPLLGGSDDGDHALARAVLTDALGPAAVGDLQQWDSGLTEDFLQEVISLLPTEEFELPMHTVAAWVVRRSLSEAPSPEPAAGSWSKRQTTLGLRTVPSGGRSGEALPGG